MVPRYCRYVYRKTLTSLGIARHTIVLGTLSEAHRTPKLDWAPVTVSSQAHTHSLRGPCRSLQPVQEYRFRYHNRRELLTVVSINELPGTQLLENTVLSIKKLVTRKGKTGQFLSPPKHGGFHDQKPPMPYALSRRRRRCTRPAAGRGVIL